MPLGRSIRGVYVLFPLALACGTEVTGLTGDAGALLNLPRPGVSDGGVRDAVVGDSGPDSGVLPDAQTFPDAQPLPDVGPGMVVFFRDQDLDGFTGSETIVAVTDPDGTGAEWVEAATELDCDDDPATCGAKCFPGNAEPDTCDGFDQQCNGSADDAPDLTWYPDRDGDGHGDNRFGQVACQAPSDDMITTGGDCDDRAPICFNNCRTCAFIAPRARFVVTPSAGTSTTTFVFDASSSADDQAGLTYRWDLDDDGNFEVTGGDPGTRKTFAALGLHRVRLRVTDGLGLVDEMEGWVTTAPSERLITVTTGDDAEEPAPGTSLREAIQIANDNPGPDVIRFASAITVTLNTPLPNVTGEDTWLMGMPGAKIVGTAGATDYCMAVDAARFGGHWLEMRGCTDDALEIRADEGWVANSKFVENGDDGLDFAANSGRAGPNVLSAGNGDSGIEVEGDSVTIERNLLRDNHRGINLLRQSRTLNDLKIEANDFLANEVGVRFEPGVSHALVWHNTFFGQVSHALAVDASADGTAQTLDHDLQNNVFANNGGYALELDGSVGTVGLNLLFQNAGACTGCGFGSNPVRADPRFQDVANADLRPGLASPCVDRANDLGLDRNYGLDGSFGSLGPDLGAHESF